VSRDAQPAEGQQANDCRFESELEDVHKAGPVRPGGFP
jgi:hypothetical protein